MIFILTKKDKEDFKPEFIKELKKNSQKYHNGDREGITRCETNKDINTFLNSVWDGS